MAEEQVKVTGVDPSAARLANNLAKLRDFAFRTKDKGHWAKILDMKDSELIPIMGECRSPTATVGLMNKWLIETHGRPKRAARKKKEGVIEASPSTSGNGSPPVSVEAPVTKEPKESKELSAKELLAKLNPKGSKSDEMPDFLDK